MKGITITLLLFSTLTIFGQQFEVKTQITKTIPIENTSDTWVIINNINGNVAVTSSKNNEVTVDLILTVMADYEDDFEDGKAELGLKTAWRKNKLLIGMDAPFIIESDDEDSEWFGTNCNMDADYDYRYDFKIRVPESVNLKASTINKGDVFISGIKESIKANNVNGDIDIEQVRHVRYANTVNGHINVIFERNPVRNSKYHTVNGDITLYLNENFNAKVYSKSLNGEIYSAFDFVYLKPALEVGESSSKQGTKYRIGEPSGVEIGKDGPILQIETLNGDMYLKKI
jgi:DUF4097 and DUF4098 domain-containing protein YvlB